MAEVLNLLNNLKDIDLIKLREVKAETHLSTSSIYAMAAAGTFPKQVKTGKRSVCWVRQEVTAWKAACIAQRDGAGTSTSGRI